MNTAAQVTKVLKLHFDHGYSYGVIGLRLGMTRSRVAGVIRRHRANDATAPREPSSRDVGNKTMWAAQ